MRNLSPAIRAQPSGDVRVAYVWNPPVLDWVSTGNNPCAGLLTAARRAALQVDAGLDWDSIARLALRAYGLAVPGAGGPDAPSPHPSGWSA